MKKIMIHSLPLGLLMSTAIFAKDVKCPTAENLRSEWSISTLRGIEQLDGDQIAIYQKGHNYGTDKKWYVYFTLRANNTDEALKKAPEIINQAKFIGGGMTPFGAYSCGYVSSDVTIYAMANEVDADDEEDL